MVTIPVVGLSYADGAAIVEQVRGGATVTLHVFTSTESEVRRTVNVPTDSSRRATRATWSWSARTGQRTGRAGHRRQRQGFGDDPGDRAAAGRLHHPNRVRFAFWGAEELGLLGSAAYVASLGDAQKDAIAPPTARTT